MFYDVSQFHSLAVYQILMIVHILIHTVCTVQSEAK